ncbi:MAG: Maf family nucleotide pyrophosphatase [Pseudomonadota bacterium]
MSPTPGVFLILASESTTRQRLLHDAGVPFEVRVPRVDETSIKRALLAEHAAPVDIAASLAERKACEVSRERPDRLVLGADQVLEFEGKLFDKPRDPGDAKAQLMSLSGRTHRLISAAVICENGKRRWWCVDTARLTMRSLTRSFLDRYVDDSWEDIRYSVGAYQLEKRGAWLFQRVDGDFFTILGMPLLAILDHLRSRGGTGE